MVVTRRIGRCMSFQRLRVTWLCLEPQFQKSKAAPRMGNVCRRPILNGVVPLGTGGRCLDGSQKRRGKAPNRLRASRVPPSTARAP